MNYFKDELLRWCVLIALVALGVMIFCVYNSGADEIDDVLPFLIQAESGGDPNAVSKAGAVGLCQITPIVLKEWNKENCSFLYDKPYENAIHQQPTLTMDDMVDVKQNKRVATWYLRRLRDHYLKDVTPYIQWSEISDAKSKHIIRRSYQFGKKEGNFILFINTEPCDIRQYEIHSREDVIVALVLSGYNGGITRLKSVTYDINKMPKETQAYVKKIIKAYKEAREKD